MALSTKGKEILTLMTVPYGEARARAFDDLAGRYSHKVVVRKLEEFAARGYLEHGTAVTGGWITEKGRQALADDRPPAWPPEDRDSSISSGTRFVHACK